MHDPIFLQCEVKTLNAIKYFFIKFKCTRYPRHAEEGHYIELLRNCRNLRHGMVMLGLYSYVIINIFVLYRSSASMNKNKSMLVHVGSGS